jgi:adenylyltransferase and sulfurtransferase
MDAIVFRVLSKERRVFHRNMNISSSSSNVCSTSQIMMLCLKMHAYVRDHSLSNDDIQRYSRQLILSDFGVSSQQRLKQASALVIGCGGLGSPAALYLASSGLGRLGLVDHDHVDMSNLHRQVIHREATIGQSKVHSARLTCSQINSSIIIDVYEQLLTDENIMNVIRTYDVILDCTDNVITRYLINDACVLSQKPLVSASVIRFEGQLAVWNYRENDGPCYRCLYPQAPPAETVSACSDVGVLGPVCGTLGSLQALEAIKILTRSGDVLSNRMLLFDGLSMNFRTIKLRHRQATCAVCGINPSITHRPAVRPVEQCSHDKPCQKILLRKNERITSNELATLNRAPLIVDVRPEHELKIVHFENSFHLPIDRLLYSKNDEQLRDELRTKIMDDDQTIVIVCRRGNDSQLAVRKLKELFADTINIDEKIKDLEGGLQAWHTEIDRNFPSY